MTYEVRIFAGDYAERQAAANAWGADVYLEQHFNAKLNDAETDLDNSALCVVASNAGTKSRQLGASYAAAAAKAFGIRDSGVLVAPFGRSGDGNLRLTKMPAVILEPLFVSDLSQAEIASSPEGQRQIAELAVDLVRQHFPDGAKVALSHGHRGQRSKQDPGAPAANGRWEGDLAVAVVAEIAQLFRELNEDPREAPTHPEASPERLPTPPRVPVIPLVGKVDEAEAEDDDVHIENPDIRALMKLLEKRDERRDRHHAEQLDGLLKEFRSTRLAMELAADEMSKAATMSSDAAIGANTAVGQMREELGEFKKRLTAVEQAVEDLRKGAAE